MRAFTLDHLSDDTLLAELAALVATDRQTTAAMLAHLAEVDERKLFLPAACASMHAYCTRVLHLAEEVAYKRIRAARIARRFPVIFDFIADGRLHVSGVVMLAPHLNHENVNDVLAAASHRSKAELEELVARIAPRPDLPQRMERVPGGGEALQVDLDPPARASDLDRSGRPLDLDPPPGRIQARSPDRYGLQVTIEGATRDKLRRAQALLRHRNPRGELAEVIDVALDALLEKLEKQKFGRSSQPRKAKVRGEDADARYVPTEVRRVVSERDGEQCSFVSDDGVRCSERGFLELDHRTMVCRGGQPTADGLRWLCKAHNQYEAERLLGADFMRAKREQARERRGGVAARRTTDARPTAPPLGHAPADETAGSRHAPADETAGSRHAPADETAGSRHAPADETAGSRHAPADETAGSRSDGDAGARPFDAGAFDAEVTLALRGLGFAAAEVRRAMAATADVPAATLEARLRAALAALAPVHPFRCSEGPFDALALALAGPPVGRTTMC